MVAKYDKNGSQIEEAYFDKANKPIPKTEILATLVVPNSQGEKLGIQAGEVFTHYEGDKILNAACLIASRNTEQLDAPARNLQILRDGKVLTFSVLPGELGVELQTRTILSSTHDGL